MCFSKLPGLLSAIVFGVTACAYVPASSLLKLSGVDMLTIDPGQIRVAVAMAEVLSVRNGGAVLETGARKSASGPADTGRFVLEEESGALHKPDLPGDNSNVSVFRVAEIDLDRLRALQKRIANRKARFPGDVDGFLTVAAKACRTGALPDTGLPVTTWLKTRDDQPFFVLTRETDLKSVVPAEALSAEVPPCGR